MKNAAWYYPTPFDKAQNIKDYVAFCKRLRKCEDKVCTTDEHIDKNLVDVKAEEN